MFKGRRALWYHLKGPYQLQIQRFSLHLQAFSKEISLKTKDFPGKSALLAEKLHKKLRNFLKKLSFLKNFQHSSFASLTDILLARFARWASSAGLRSFAARAQTTRPLASLASCHVLNEKTFQKENYLNSSVKWVQIGQIKGKMGLLKEVKWKLAAHAQRHINNLSKLKVGKKFEKSKFFEK